MHWQLPRRAKARWCLRTRRDGFARRRVGRLLGVLDGVQHMQGQVLCTRLRCHRPQRIKGGKKSKGDKA